MAPDVELVNADELFADTLLEIFERLGINASNYSNDEIHGFIALAASQSGSIWEEYENWVLYGEKKAETLNLIRSSIKLSSPLLKFRH